MTLFNFRYRVESARHPHWDYHSPGWYFITICTKNRIHYFGSVINRRMILSPVGKIVEFELLRTPKIRDNVAIDTWVIMPNHVHIIFHVFPVSPAVETHCSASLPTGQPDGGQNPSGQPDGGQNPSDQPDGGNRFGPQSGNLPAIVRGLKSAVKRQTNIHGLEFHWQARYHDHIIRNEAELQRIRGYILENVNMWKSDAANRKNRLLL
jgi:putative transposase